MKILVDKLIKIGYNVSRKVGNSHHEKGDDKI